MHNRVYCSLTLAFILILINACSDTAPSESQLVDQQEMQTYQVALEKGNIGIANEIRLKYFAKALAKSLTESDVGRYLKNEMGKKFDGEYNVLWESVKEKEFSSRRDLRYIIASNLKSINRVVSTIEECEAIDNLQIALPVGFEEWDGETPLLVAYTPLTKNDIDVDEIYAYDSNGEEYILDGQEPPEFPVLVVGINERESIAEYLLEEQPISLKKSSGVSSIRELKITEVNLDKSARDYEPWWMGTNAELYFWLYDPEASDSDLWGLGLVAPDNGFKDYKCWKWKTYRYVQTKPWRTINLNTGWDVQEIIGSGRTLSLRLIEYDPLFYDLDRPSAWWCTVASALMAYDQSTLKNWAGTALWACLSIACALMNNDDKIGTKALFDDYLVEAYNHPGVLYETGTSAFRIKYLVE